MKRVLVIGAYSPLLASHAKALAPTGAQVDCCAAYQVFEHVENGRYDLIVLCHTLTREILPALMPNIYHRWPDARILRIFPNFSPLTYSLGVDGYASPGEPERLFELASELLHKSTRSRWRSISDPLQAY